MVGVDVVGEGAGGSGPEVGKELVLSVERDDRKWEFRKDRGGRGGRGNDSDGGFDNGGREILDWDVREWNAVNDFLELKMDVRVLDFVGGGVLELWA